MQIGPFSIHRKVQDDLGCAPIVCVHYREPNSSTRIFCLWVEHGQVHALIGQHDLKSQRMRPFEDATHATN